MYVIVHCLVTTVTGDIFVAPQGPRARGVRGRRKTGPLPEHLARRILVGRPRPMCTYNGRHACNRPKRKRRGQPPAGLIFSYLRCISESKAKKMSTEVARADFRPQTKIRQVPALAICSPSPGHRGVRRCGAKGSPGPRRAAYRTRGGRRAIYAQSLQI